MRSTDDMKNGPMVSICMPVYNKAGFVGETIRSVLSQTYENWELIICDNASTDGTIDVIRDYLIDKRITLYENEKNMGLAYNFNKVFGLANGKYQKMLFADDIIYPTCLEEQVAVLEDPANANVVLSVVGRSIIGPDSRLLMKMKSSFHPGITPGKTAIKKCFYWGTNRIGETQVGLFKRMPMAEVCDWETTNDCDIGIWFGLLKRGDLHYLPKYLSAFRISPGAMTSQMKLDYPKHYCRLFTQVYREKDFDISRPLLMWCKFMSYSMHIARTLFMKAVYSR